MGMFNFFRGGKSVDVKSESVAFDDVRSWLENKDKILKKEETGVLEEIGERLNEFYVAVEEKLSVLEGIDIEGKKEYERAKILVRQGLNKYIISVRVLLKELTKIDLGNFGEFAEEIGKVFNYFEKSSAKFYARANYLVGDEMAAVRNEVRRFYNEMVGILERPLIGKLKKVEDVRAKLDEFEKVEIMFKKIGNEIVVRDKKIDRAREKVKGLEIEIEDIKNSADHVAGIKAREDVIRLRAGLDREIGRLKELIDFKRLTNLVHSNERELQIVKDYRAHFVEEFGKDNGKRLFGLMSGSSLMNDKIRAKVALIEKLGVEMAEKSGGIGKDYTVGKLKEIESVKDECKSVELENVKSGRRLDELRLRLKGLRNEVILLVDEIRN